jgi:NAD(P)-dependent dehydrogenase (short-subunit alcohol dehydrogenase family)
VPGTVINIVCRPSQPVVDRRFGTHLTQGVVIAFTKALATELADRGIRINAIVGASAGGPGQPLRTPFEEVVQAALFLCAPDTFVTGETVDLGGRAIGYEADGFPA